MVCLCPLQRVECATLLLRILIILILSIAPLAATMYKRRSSVARIVRWAFSKRFKIDVCCNYWNHEPQSVSENSQVKLLWDFNIYTDLVLSVH